ncbi:Mur ligase domain-containing protein [Thermomonospora umbrina]|uniref:Mur ligase domain-containing protein n=1 Tax=Thermomonospora umbrina TaxID=111806 RepID=UPI000E273B7F|nr:Mur ligase domain-containing protein [Thermomonospora umbrina]
MTDMRAIRLDQFDERSVPDLTRPHFVGIGGVGMAPLALACILQDSWVSGSDVRHSPTTRALIDGGIPVGIGHRAGNLPPDATCVVVSSALEDDNPEVTAARLRGLPVVHRAQVLHAAASRNGGYVAVTGTHGKSTTTAMLAAMAGEQGSFVIGAQPVGAPVAQVASEPFTVEADESDRSFLFLSPDVAVINSVSDDHPETYPTLDDAIAAHAEFARQTRTPAPTTPA